MNCVRHLEKKTRSRCLELDSKSVGKCKQTHSSQISQFLRTSFNVASSLDFRFVKAAKLCKFDKKSYQNPSKSSENAKLHRPWSRVFKIESSSVERVALSLEIVRRPQSLSLSQFLPVALKRFWKRWIRSVTVLNNDFQKNTNRKDALRGNPPEETQTM